MVGFVAEWGVVQSQTRAHVGAGPMPRDLWKLAALRDLRLHNNGLTGELISILARKNGLC